MARECTTSRAKDEAVVQEILRNTAILHHILQHIKGG